jgi:hypothetical protein
MENRTTPLENGGACEHDAPICPNTTDVFAEATDTYSECGWTWDVTLDKI